MKKIVLVCNEYPPRPHGGIGTAVQTIARGLSRKGHAITVVGLGDRAEEEKDEAIRVFTLPRDNRPLLGNLVSRIRLGKWVNNYVKKEKIDLVEVPDSAGLLPFGVKGCTAVVRLHLSFTAVSRATGESVGKAISIFERQTVSRIPNWIAVSNYVRDLTHTAFGLTSRRCVTIYNPIFPPPPVLPDMPQLPAEFILYAGHICRRKGADVLARSVRNILVQNPALHLVYAGGNVPEDGRRSAGEDIIDIMGPSLAPRLHFLGWLDRPKVLACMKRARVFAFPSRIEGFPMVILEALSCGAPVVYSSQPPGPEIIEHGRSGLLADPRNPIEFGAAIAQVLENPVLAKSLGEAGRKRVNELFTVENCVNGTEQFYESCLAA